VDTEVVLDHQAGEHRAVDQHHPRVDPLEVLASFGVERGSGSEYAFSGSAALKATRKTLDADDRRLPRCRALHSRRALGRNGQR